MSINDGTESVQRRIEKRLRPYIDEDELASVCTAVLDGHVVKLGNGRTLDIVALRRGVLYVAGTEYVVGD